MVRRLPGGRGVNLCLHVDLPRGSCVLRLRHAGDATPGADFRRELACHAAAAAAGLAPRILAADAAEGWMLMPLLAEAPWQVEDLDDPLRVRALAARLGALHALAPPSLPPLDLRGLVEGQARALAAAGVAPPAALSLARQLAAELSREPTVQPVICHGDPDVGNLLGAAPMLVDFEYAQLAEPLWDLGLLLAYYPRLRGAAGPLLHAAGLDPEASGERLRGFAQLAAAVNALWSALPTVPHAG